MQTRWQQASAGIRSWTVHLFGIDIDQVTFITYDPGGSGDQHVAMWPPGREFIRHGTSATSVGDPELVSDIIQPAS
jgi:hypothetical protein